MWGMNRFLIERWAIVLLLCLSSAPAPASHRALLFNERAMDLVLDIWPDFVEEVNARRRGMENPGERAVIIQSPLASYLNNLLREQPTPEQFAEGFRILAREYYHPAGITAFGSRLEAAEHVTAFQYMLRKEGRLPSRFAWGMEIASSPLAEVTTRTIYEAMGVMWQTIESNPWLWNHGISSEGDWDSPHRPCLGDDLPVKAGVDEREVKETRELCPDFGASTVQGILRGLEAGWRFAGVHGSGSHGFRLFIERLEEAMARNPKVLTLDYVRNARHGFAHGTMPGIVPEVMAGLKKYNVYVPINVRRALSLMPPVIRESYGEPGWKFLAPVRSLLEYGVKVVGEGEQSYPRPDTYFKLLDVYVNRELEQGGEGSEGRMPPERAGEGISYTPEEGVGRVTALKLFTYRSAEFLQAESKIGSLEPGKYADFIVVDKPYLSGVDAVIKDNKVIMTVVAGDSKYQDPEYKVTEHRGAVTPPAE